MIGLEVIGLKTIGLEMIRLEAIGLEMIELEIIGLDVIRLEIIGLEMIELEMIVNPVEFTKNHRNNYVACNGGYSYFFVKSLKKNQSVSFYTCEKCCNNDFKNFFKGKFHT